MTTPLNKSEPEVKPTVKSLQVCARAWCQPNTKHLVMNTDLCIEFAKILESEMENVASSSEAVHKALDQWYSLFDKDILGWEKGEPTDRNAKLFSNLLDQTRECLGMDKLPPTTTSSEAMISIYSDEYKRQQLEASKIKAEGLGGISSEAPTVKEEEDGKEVTEGSEIKDAIIEHLAERVSWLESSIDEVLNILCITNGEKNPNKANYPYLIHRLTSALSGINSQTNGSSPSKDSSDFQPKSASASSSEATKGEEEFYKKHGRFGYEPCATDGIAELWSKRGMVASYLMEDDAFLISKILNDSKHIQRWINWENGKNIEQWALEVCEANERISEKLAIANKKIEELEMQNRYQEARDHSSLKSAIRWCNQVEAKLKKACEALEKIMKFYENGSFASTISSEALKEIKDQ